MILTLDLQMLQHEPYGSLKLIELEGATW